MFSFVSEAYSPYRLQSCNSMGQYRCVKPFYNLLCLNLHHDLLCYGLDWLYEGNLMCCGRGIDLIGCDERGLSPSGSLLARAWMNESGVFQARWGTLPGFGRLAHAPDRASLFQSTEMKHTRVNLYAYRDGGQER